MTKKSLNRGAGSEQYRVARLRQSTIYFRARSFAAREKEVKGFVNLTIAERPNVY